MSAPFNDFAPWAVLIAALIGSGHCVTMCGGLVLAAGKRPMQIAQYQAGRLLSYALLGGLSGALGQTVLAGKGMGNASRWMGILTAALMGAGFLALGVQVWRGRGMHFRLPGALSQLPFKLARLGSFGTGMASAFLPCGWLQSFVLGAAVSGGFFQGAVLLGIFWLGNLPALSFAPWVLRTLARPFSSSWPRISGALLIGAGLITVGYRILPALQAQEPEQNAVQSCHEHSE